jgi:hypothetical protein
VGARATGARACPKDLIAPAVDLRYYQTVMGLAPIYWNVLWVNTTTITVNGDVFYRRQ